jgi:hypothetical protein
MEAVMQCPFQAGGTTLFLLMYVADAWKCLMLFPVPA